MLARVRRAVAELRSPNEVAAIETKPCSIAQAREKFTEFIQSHDTAGGENMRMEDRSTLRGRRLVIVFDWED